MTTEWPRRTRAAAISVAAAVALAFLGASSLKAGGDVFRVRIRDFKAEGEYGARFTAVVAADEQALPGGCRELEGRARYAWWKWLWDDVGGHVSRRSQVAALKVLEAAAADGELLGFGYVGTGWSAPEASRPCSVISNALVVESADTGPPGMKASVLSFFTAP